MFKKLSNLKLIGILVILGAAYLILEFTANSGRSRSFREVLVDIDTAKVNKILISKGDKQVQLDKEGGNWELLLDNGKKVPAISSNVRNALSTLNTIKPSRIVARKSEKWNEYQVDTAGIQVQVFEGNTKSLDIIIGKFGVKGQRQFYTHVRLTEDDEVYIADNFMGISFPSDAASFRNKQLVRFVIDSLTGVQYDYPADTSFTVLKTIDDNWVIDGNSTDSASTVRTLRSFRFVSGRDFVDDINFGESGTELLTLTLNLKSEEDIVVKAYSHPQHQWILNSTLNPEAYFSDDGNNLIKKLYKYQQEYFANN